MHDNDDSRKGFETRMIHAGMYDDRFGSAVVPIYQTSTFRFRSVAEGAARFAGKGDGYIYTRLGNPTIEALEAKLAALESGRHAIVAASGMGAVNGVFATFLTQGDHMIGSRSVYGPTRLLIEQLYSRWGVEYDFIDTTDAANVAAHMRPNTRLVFVETPANPTMEVSDIAAIAEIAHQHGALLAVDNTFCTPYLQRPLTLGADIVVHSMTKAINGHADVIAGAIITDDEALHQQLRGVAKLLGPSMDPHAAFLVDRGLKTLSLRVERAQENAQRVAEFLESHPKVAWVRYPGLASFPYSALVRRQMKGPGMLMSFGLKGGYDAAVTMLNHVRLAMLAVSLGGVETLIQHPASMTHVGLPKAEREEAGITDDLIRLSVGVENVDDLIADFSQALDRVGK